MAADRIDRKNLNLATDALKRHGDLHVEVRDSSPDDVMIIVTQAFGPRGDSLVGLDDVLFDGFPGIAVRVVAEGRDERVYLSPFHGDRRKKGMEGLPPGTRCQLLCPVSGAPLDRVERDDGPDKPGYHAIYLSPRLSKGEMVAISDIWGDYSSQVVDHFDIISSWAPDEASTGSASQ